MNIELDVFPSHKYQHTNRWQASGPKRRGCINTHIHKRNWALVAFLFTYIHIETARCSSFSLSLSLRMHDGLSLTQSLAHTLSPSAIRIRPRLCNHRRHGFCVLHSNSYRLWVLCIEPDIGSMLILILDATSVNLTLALYIFLFVFMYAHSILCSLHCIGTERILALTRTHSLAMTQSIVHECIRAADCFCL